MTGEQYLSLNILRGDVSKKMSPKRFFHTTEVEKMATRLAAIYLPEEEYRLRAAALLHDIAKELDRKEQIEICSSHGDLLSAEDLFSPKTHHARAGAFLIPEIYPDFDDPLIISAVRWHTTGREGMTLPEKLIYLADYIDMSRKFESCVAVREFFFSAEPEKMNEGDRLRHLDKTLIKSFDYTICELLDEGRCISADTVAARNGLIISQSI